jgi:hypothetical protein
MKNSLKMIIGVVMIGLMAFLSGCNEAPAPSKSNVSSHGDEQMWQQFQSKQATDQLDKDFK